MLSDRLAQWTNQFQIKHNAVDSLLNILRENGHPELPKTARTLLATCDRVDWEVKSEMKYIYMGQRTTYSTFEDVSQLSLRSNGGTKHFFEQRWIVNL